MRETPQRQGIPRCAAGTRAGTVAGMTGPSGTFVTNMGTLAGRAARPYIWLIRTRWQPLLL